MLVFVPILDGDDATDAPTMVATPTVMTVSDPSTVLDDVFPDRPEAIGEGPTPDASGAADAAASLRVVETAWVRSAFDDLDFVVLIRNHADVGFGNVNVEAIFVDAGDAELAREAFSYPAVPAGGEIVLSGLRPIDPDAVAEIRVETSARGTIPSGAPALEVIDIAWHQDPAGTLTLSGSVVATEPAAFVSVVGILRDGDGTFLGTAFAFVDSVTDEARPFEAVGFPDADVADVEVHLSG